MVISLVLPKNRVYKLFFGFLYNTTIDEVLTSRSLSKVRNILNFFKENNGKAFVIWRPHPLLRQTLVSMLPDLVNEYDEIITEIKEKNIPIRIINLKLAKAINIKGTTFGKGSSETYEYIGRGSKWGNPYSMYENGDDRDEVIRKFKYDFDFDKFLNVKKEDFIHLKGKKLGCFCKPQACHGDVIADYLNSLDDGE